MVAHGPKLVGKSKIVVLGKSVGAGTAAGAATTFGSSPVGFSAVCGVLTGVGLLFPLALVAAVGYLGYRACLHDGRKIPGSGFNPTSPAADHSLNDGRLFHPSQTKLTEACRNIVGT